MLVLVQRNGRTFRSCSTDRPRFRTVRKWFRRYTAVRCGHLTFWLHKAKDGKIEESESRYR